MKTKSILCLAVLLLISCQGQSIKWKKEFKSRNHYITNAINAVPTEDGFIVMISNTGWCGDFIPERKPIVNTDTVDRIWVFKFDFDGDIKWKYLLDVCHGFDAGRQFSIERKNNTILMHGQLLNSYPSQCDDFSPYILLALDEKGNELFFKKFKEKPDYLKSRSKDALVINRFTPNYHPKFHSI
jgi:hypothetical protein